MHDADRAMTMPAGVDELSDALDGFRGGLAMQVETVSRGVLASFQPAKFATVHAVRDVASLQTLIVIGLGRRRQDGGRV